jgi:putative transposase
MESYNGRMRDELLNQHWWRSIAEARDAADAYRKDFNEVRPHSALDNRTPGEFARC